MLAEQEDVPAADWLRPYEGWVEPADPAAAARVLPSALAAGQDFDLAVQFVIVVVVAPVPLDVQHGANLLAHPAGNRHGPPDLHRLR